MRGLIGPSDPAAVLRQVGDRLGAGRTVVVSDAVASLVGALGRVGPGAVLAAGSGVVALATDLDRVWRRVDGWGHAPAAAGRARGSGWRGCGPRSRPRTASPVARPPCTTGGAGVGPAARVAPVVMTTTDRRRGWPPSPLPWPGWPASTRSRRRSARPPEPGWPSTGLGGRCGTWAAGDGGRGAAADDPPPPPSPASAGSGGWSWPPRHRPGRRAGPGSPPRAGAPAGRPVAVPAGGLRTRRARLVGRSAAGRAPGGGG